MNQNQTGSFVHCFLIETASHWGSEFHGFPTAGVKIKTTWPRGPLFLDYLKPFEADKCSNLILKAQKNLWIVGKPKLNKITCCILSSSGTN